MPGLCRVTVGRTGILRWVVFPFSRGVFPAQGSNPGLLHCRRILYQEVVVKQICEYLIYHWIVHFKMADFFFFKEENKESKSMAKEKCKI